MRYNPALDGIRAVAILAVLVFHVSPTVLRGGFAGVDVFFVLSGFLITSIIIHDLRNRDFSFREFYLRRAQRLLPNMVAMVMGVLVLWALWMPPTSASQPGRHGMWALLNLSNIHIWRHLGGYWGDAAEQAPLTHTWSLAIEEQFYLLFPLTLFLLSRWMDERRVRLVLSLAAVVSFVACAIGTFIQPTATFYSLPTRSWELLLGSIIAISRKSDTPGGASFTEGGLRSGIEWAGCLGLALIGISFVVLDERSGFPGVVVLLPTIGTTLLIVAALDQGSKVARLLATPVLVEVGKMSYSVYLWHWPFIVFARFHMELRDYPRDVGAVFGGLAGTLIGCLAYFIVEQPLRSRGPGRMRRVAVIATGFVATLTACVIVANRIPVIDPLHRFDTPSFSGMSFDAGRPTIENLAKAVRYSDVVFAAPPLGLADAWRSGGIIHRFGGGNPAVVVLGSSHALMYSRLVDGICREKSVSVAFLGVDGNPAFFETVANQSFPSPKEAREFDAARRRWLREWRPSVVFVIDRWDIRAGISGDFGARLRSFLGEVAPLAEHVYFVAQPPVIKDGENVNLRGLVSWLMNQDGELPRLAVDGSAPLRRKALEEAEAATAAFPNLHVLRADLPFYAKDGSVRYASGRSFLYADDDHLSDVGTEEVRGLFEKAIDTACMVSHGDHP